MAAVGPTRTSHLREEQQVKPERVFGTDIFELFIRQVCRIHILQQFNPDGSLAPIIETDTRLIAESTEKILAHLGATEAEWKGLAFRLRKIVLVRHFRELAAQRMEEHTDTQDLDEDKAQAALENIMALDFEEVFPKSWVDG